MTTTFLHSRAGVHDAGTVIGLKVQNARGENLGKIDSLMLDLSESRILYAVLSFGGFLGMGDKLFPVPMTALGIRTDEKGCPERAILDVEKETLKKAPGFDREHLPESTDRQFAGRIYSHYGYSPYWTE